MIYMELLNNFARAGGGGSSSNGSPFGLLAIPLLAATGVSGFVYTKVVMSKPAGIIAGCITGFLVSILFIPLGPVYFVSALLASVIGAFMGPLADKLNFFRRHSKMAREAAQQAATTDSAWDEQAIIEYATGIFKRFQVDWQNGDLAAIKQYSTENYAKHVELMLYALQQMGRVNQIDNVVIKETILTLAHDNADNSKDRVSVSFLAKADDRLVDAASNTVLTKTKEEFGEQWNFVRTDKGWLLDSIDQATKSSGHLILLMRLFAREHKMFYSADWGSLLLPTRGQLFKNGFKGADINNHIIGLWKNDLLVQLYTYQRILNRNKTAEYCVGQVNLPKSYGGILVERADGGLLTKRLTAPSGYKKVELEWGDFNKRYNVYATDENQVTSFELLNPAFMAWLYDRNLKVNIEVVDNVVYLYARVYAVGSSYNEMMEILQKAHKELKM